MKSFLILGFIVISSLAQSQKEKSEEVISQKNHTITVNVLSPTVFLTPRIAVGYYYKLNSTYKVGLEIGYGNNSIDLYEGNQLSSNQYRSYHIKPEIFYILNSERKSPKFISLDAEFVRHTDFDARTTVYNYDSNQSYYYENADYTRTKISINANYGMFVYFNSEKTFGMMPKIGIGMKYRSVSYDNQTYSVMVIEDERHTDWYSSYYNEGKNVAFHFQIGLNLHFSF